MNNVTLTSIIGNWNLDKTVNAMFWTTIVATAIIITILAVTIFKFKHGADIKHKRFAKVTLISASICAILSFAVMLTLNISYSVAQKHGAYTRNMTIETMYDGIARSPIESTLPENLDGCIIIYYRFDCPDCKAIYDDLMTASENVDNIYFVSSRSEQGSALLNQFPVEEVPSGIYIRMYTYNGALTYTKKVLYYTDENGNIIFDVADFNRLVALRAEQK